MPVVKTQRLNVGMRDIFMIFVQERSMFCACRTDREDHRKILEEAVDKSLAACKLFTPEFVEILFNLSKKHISASGLRECYPRFMDKFYNVEVCISRFCNMFREAANEQKARDELRVLKSKALLEWGPVKPSCFSSLNNLPDERSRLLMDMTSVIRTRGRRVGELLSVDIIYNALHNPGMSYSNVFDEWRRLVVLSGTKQEENFGDEFWMLLGNDMSGRLKPSSSERLYMLLTYMRNEIACWCLPFSDKALKALLSRDVQRMLDKDTFDMDSRLNIVVSATKAISGNYIFYGMNGHAADVDEEMEDMKKSLVAARFKKHDKAFFHALKQIYDMMQRVKKHLMEEGKPLASTSAMAFARLVVPLALGTCC